MAEDGDVDSRIAEYHKQLNLLSSKEYVNLFLYTRISFSVPPIRNTHIRGLVQCSEVLLSYLGRDVEGSSWVRLHNR